MLCVTLTVALAKTGENDVVCSPYELFKVIKTDLQ